MAQPVIDAKLPLPWVLGMAGAIVFAMGANIYKLEALTTAVNKSELRSEVQGEKVGLISQTLVLLQSQTARNTDDIKDLKAQERARK